MAKNKITVETLVLAPVDKVWEFWTFPQHIVNWNFATDDWHCPKAENKLVNGGKFNYVMASKDGKVSFNFEGVYDEVSIHEKISYSLEDGRKVCIKFHDLEGVTKINETFDAEHVHSAEMQKNGWQSILDNFKKYVELNQKSPD